MILPGLFVYWIVVALMMAGLYIVISRRNLIKQMVGLGIFQASVLSSISRWERLKAVRRQSSLKG